MFIIFNKKDGGGRFQLCGQMEKVTYIGGCPKKLIALSTVTEKYKCHMRVALCLNIFPRF